MERKEYDEKVVSAIYAELEPFAENIIPTVVLDTINEPYEEIVRRAGYLSGDPDFCIRDELLDIAKNVIRFCKIRENSPLKSFVLDNIQLQLIDRNYTKNQNDFMRELVTGHSRPLDIALIARFDSDGERYEELEDYDIKTGSAPAIAKKVGQLESKLERVGGELKVRKVK